MYESPRDMLDSGGPQNIVSALLLTRIAGGLFLMSVVLPHVFSVVSYATYIAPSGREVSMDYPFSFESLLFAAEGTIIGPAQTVVGAESAARGLLLGFIDLVFLPFLWIGLPIMSVVIGLLPIVFGIILVFGYDKRPFSVALGYILTFSVYSLLLGMKSVTMAHGVGSGLCFIATLIVFGVGIDRYHDLGILHHPGYDDAGWGSGSV